ncbi:hypothetical protein BCI9360_02003 [Bacillus sp. CECT 9360]|nr:hypothetical protein BCI9360_02003 [Bacillus sp. CECT 9360]
MDLYEIGGQRRFFLLGAFRKIKKFSDFLGLSCFFSNHQRLKEVQKMQQLKSTVFVRKLTKIDSFLHNPN